MDAIPDGRVPHQEWHDRSFPIGDPPSVATDRTPQQQTLFSNAHRNSRFDYSAFINSMDDDSFAYLCSTREFAARTLHGNAAQYSGLYSALALQTIEEETRSRISVIEFKSRSLRSRSFKSFEEFKAYMDMTPKSSKGLMKRLFVLEDMPVRLVCLLGSRLGIRPSVFAQHYTIEDSSALSTSICSLPSIEKKMSHNGVRVHGRDDPELTEPYKNNFTLTYPIVMPEVSAKQHPDPEKCPPWLKADSRLGDQSAYPWFVVERCLETPNKHDRWDARGETSELEGQVTYWCRKVSADSWEGLLLVDPCLKDPAHLAVINGSPWPDIRRIVRYPELETQEDSGWDCHTQKMFPGPVFTRYNLHDDILIHFSTTLTAPDGDPLSVTQFLRIFAISKWTAHLNHIRRSYINTRNALFSNTSERHPPETGTAFKHTARWGANWKEWMFETMTQFITDLYLHRLAIETNMRALGIDVDDSQSYGFVGKREAQMWRVLRATCLDLQDMFKHLSNSYTQVIALREAQASNVQANSVRWLTVLGTFFVPMSVVAGILSMGGEFLPGEGKFWVYLSVVCPLLLIIAAILGLTMGRSEIVQLVEYLRLLCSRRKPRHSDAGM